MANKDHAEWLKEGVGNWNHRRKKVRFKPDLSQVNFFELLPKDYRDDPKASRFFEKIDLSGADLTSANLSNLNFIDANLENSVLQGANVSKTNFSSANFKNADLKGVDGRYSNFSKSYFENSDLAGANFMKAIFDNAIFVATDLKRIENPPKSLATTTEYASVEVYEKVIRDAFLEARTPRFKRRYSKTLGPGDGDSTAKLLDDRTKKNRYDVYYATNRNPITQRGKIIDYGNKNTGKLSYGISEVIVPEGHRIGSLGSPLWKRLINRKDDRLKLEHLITLSEELFWKQLKDTAAKMQTQAHPTAFIHGYNTSFEQATMRAAQLGYDLGIGQGVGLFSWPSKGNFLKYAADEASVESSKYLLAEFIKDFAKNSPTGQLNLIAHSMGCRCLTGALELLSSSGKGNLKGINQIVLAAADIDNNIMPHQCGPALLKRKRVTSYVSDLDMALKLSGWLHSYPRVGITPPTFVLDGVDTIVVNDISLGDLKHGYVSSSRTVISDIFYLLKEGWPPTKRHSLEPISDHHGNYFRIKN